MNDSFTPIDSLIRECCTERGRQELPIILLMGPPGSGKTPFLRVHHDRCSGVRPCALQDLGGSDMRPHKVAAHLAYDLTRRVKVFGRLEFPRLLLGLIAINCNLNELDRSKARRELETLLDDRRALAKKISELVNDLLNEVRLPTGGRTAIRITIRGIVFMVQALKIRGRGVRWYRGALGQTIPDPLDALVELNRMEAKGSRDQRSQVDEVLCRAFLSDLRTELSRAPKRFGNCLVLLDNADSHSGQAFLKVLARARSHDAPQHDRLLAVATGRTRFSRLGLGEDRGPTIRQSDEVTYEDWDNKRVLKSEDNRMAELQSWIYPVEMVFERRDPADAPQWRQEEFVQRLTLGHPWGKELIRQVIKEGAGSKQDLSGLLDWSSPDLKSHMLANAAVDRLLRGTSDSLRRSLITCAAASDLSDMSREQALDDTGPQLRELDRFCSTSLWVLYRHGHPELHPFLRRILLHLLARRPETKPDSWQAVNSRLRSYYGERNATQAKYHALALGDFADVTSHLHKTFATDDMTTWLRDVRKIASAPRPATSAIGEPREQIQKLAPQETDVLAQLVAALWIASDPLGDPNATLDADIEGDFELLATKTEHQRHVLRAEARRYRERSERD